MAIKRIGPGFELDKSMRRFNQFKQTAPRIIANNSLNWFLKGFRKSGGQTDDSKSGWEARQPSAKRNAGRGILVDTGALRRSIKVFKANFKEIIIGTTGIPYANRHNEGLKGMPKREFIGDSKGLDSDNKKTLVKMLTKVFR